MIHYPTIKQLRYFVALAETEHFGQAARQCHVSQSAFSNAIQELESLLDVQLVDRTNRQVTITATGREVAAQARLCLHDVTNLMETASRQRKPLSGDLRLGVIPTIAPFLLPGILPRLRKAYPDLKLYLIEEQTAVLHEQLLDGKLDVILIALPYDLRGIEEMALFRDRFLLAFRKGSDHVEPGNYKLNRLDMESVILLQDGHCLRDHALDACRLRNSQRVSPFAASSLLTLVEMVDADLGVSYLPEMAQGSALLRNTRVQMQPVGEKSFRTIGLVWRRSSNNSEEFRLLGEFLRDNR